jgi:hypothetical protein
VVHIPARTVHILGDVEGRGAAMAETSREPRP